MTSEETRFFVRCIRGAAQALKDRRDEVNKLNVFPVPDGDTGTNMSLTMDAVVGEVDKLAADADLAAIAHAVTHGSLMGARGNSGVILSQILRGLCEVIGQAEELDADLVRSSLQRSVTVAFQAVRKPVEGTMLTVLRDSAEAAAGAETDGPLAVLRAAVDEGFESVRRTPDLLPVLKEAGVVDAGGYGLAILAEGLLATIEGHDARVFDVTVAEGPAVAVGTTSADDWDDEEYLYCTEFLLFGEGLDREVIEDYVAGRGGSQLVVGSGGELKIHVHTDDPSDVLAYATGLGEVAEVHIHNMRRQTEARAQALRDAARDRKPLGFVAVAVGSGVSEILESLGVDKVVSGGQTMNPSTADILAAVEEVNADAVVVMPNNRNIIMAAQQTVGIASKPVAVVPTTAVPQAFTAMLAADPSSSLEENTAAMTEAAEAVRTGEITKAIKDSRGKVGRIKAGQIIGIADHEIEAVGTSVPDVAVSLLEVIGGEGDTLTLLAGADLSDEEAEAIRDRLAEARPDLEIESYRGDQPLYPLIMAIE